MDTNFIVVKQKKRGGFIELQYCCIEDAIRAYGSKYAIVLYTVTSGVLSPLRSKMNDDKLYSQAGVWDKLQKYMKER